MATLERPLAVLRAADLRAAVEAFRDALRAHQDELNRLNVYPVPDGDTGTNMALTLEAVCTELRTAEAMPEVCHAISRGSLMGARGNSGVITSQILRGLAEVFAPLTEIGPREVVAALRRATDSAYEAVLRPVEGTILTAVRETAEAVEQALEGATERAGAAALSELLDVAAGAAGAAVTRTPELLPVLAGAGVVDAGAKGFTLFIDALAHVVDGRPMPVPEVVATPPAVTRHLAGDDVASLRYEVMYLLDAPDDTIAALRDTWATIGDSIVVVGGAGLWNCHIHTNDIGAAIEAGIGAGRPYDIRVTDLADQVPAEHGTHAGHAGHAGHAETAQWVRDAAGRAGQERSLPAVTTAVAAVAVGDGLRRLLHGLGVQQVIAGGQSMNPSTAQILEAVEACNADAVIVLPNNKNIVAVARQVDSLTDKTVEVVPTTSVIEALTALVAYDPDEAIGANTAALSEAIMRVRWGEVTQAVRDGIAECGPVRAGDWLALAREGIVATAPDPAAACVALLDRVVDDASELVTLLVGADADPSDTDRIRDHLQLAHPRVECECHEGGQPLYPYLVGVE